MKPDVPTSGLNIKKFSEKFFKKLRKYNAHLEKKVVESRNKQCFYRYINSRTREPSYVGSLKHEKGIAIKSQDKANLQANTFVKVFQHDDGKAPSTTSPDFDPMPDSHWFDTKQPTIY